MSAREWLVELLGVSQEDQVPRRPRNRHGVGER